MSKIRTAINQSESTITTKKNAVAKKNKKHKPAAHRQRMPHNPYQQQMDPRNLNGGG